MSWTLKPLNREDIPAAAALFNQSIADSEMIFSPLEEEAFERRFFRPALTPLPPWTAKTVS